MDRFHYTLEYPSESLYSREHPFNFIEIQRAVDSFADGRSSEDESVYFTLVQLNELEEEQGYPGGPKVTVRFIINCNDENVAYMTALDVMSGINANLAMQLQINPVLIQPELEQVTTYRGASLS